MKGSELNMKHGKEEILKALYIIKDECEMDRDCVGACPFERDGTCLITNDSPEAWDINDETRNIWKGLL